MIMAFNFRNTIQAEFLQEQPSPNFRLIAKNLRLKALCRILRNHGYIIMKAYLTGSGSKSAMPIAFFAPALLLLTACATQQTAAVKAGAAERASASQAWRRRLYFPAGKNVLDASIRHEPNQCNQYVQALGDPGRLERRRDGNEVDQGRQLSFPVTSDSLL